MSTTKQHDKIFKEVQSIKENAKDFLKGVCPSELTAKLDLDSLELDTDSYITGELAESFADIVYSCSYEGSRKIKVALLFEHKSYVPSYPHLQLLKYILGIWDQEIKGGKKPIPVIPLIFYHGKERWKHLPLYGYFAQEPDDILKKFIPAFDYLLADIQTLSDDAIRNTLFKREANKIVFSLMKHIFNNETLYQELKTILSLGKDYFEKEEGERFLISILLYIINYMDVSKEHITQVIREISPKGGADFMVLAEKIREEGIKEGIKEKAFQDARKMLEKGFALEDIQEITELSLAEIEALKREL